MVPRCATTAFLLGTDHLLRSTARLMSICTRDVKILQYRFCTTVATQAAHTRLSETVKQKHELTCSPAPPSEEDDSSPVSDTPAAIPTGEEQEEGFVCTVDECTAKPFKNKDPLRSHGIAAHRFQPNRCGVLGCKETQVSTNHTEPETRLASGLRASSKTKICLMVIYRKMDCPSQYSSMNQLPPNT